MISVDGLQRLSLPTKLLLLLLALLGNPAEFFLLLADLFLLHLNSGVAGCSYMPPDTFLLAGCPLHQERLAQAGSRPIFV